MRIPPLIESVGPRQELLLFSLVFRNRTMTVMSSWKCLRTPRSILFRSEYLISLFFAASCSATLISLLAIPCNKHQDVNNKKLYCSFFLFFLFFFSLHFLNICVEGVSIESKNYPEQAGFLGRRRKGGPCAAHL